MGNGASVSVTGRQLTQRDFESLEKLCRSQHFRENFRDYVEAFRKAVENDAIDMIEILIPAGNAMRVQPLHMACQLAKMDCADVLLSAGFSCMLQDELGRTPLHVCSISRSPNAGLCATLVAQAGKKALAVRDKDGLTPLHLAVAQNNLRVIEALMTNGADVSVTTPRGQTAYQIAASCENLEALQLLRDMMGTKSQALQNQKAKPIAAKHDVPGRPQTQAEYDRIMQVWERFFENAFKRMGLDPNELDDEVDRYNASPSTSARTVQSTHSRKDPDRHRSHDDGYTSKDRASAKQNTLVNDSYERERREMYSYVRDEGKWAEPSDRNRPEAEHKSNAGLKMKCKGVDVASSGSSFRSGELPRGDDLVQCLEWFEWVVRYQPPEPQEEWDEPQEGDYYVLNTRTGETAWLDDHVAAFQRRTLLSCDDWGDYELHMTQPLPVSLIEAVCRGWLTYYSAEENVCRWINIPTKCTEEFLPLGCGEDAATLAQVGLCGTGAEGVWCAADQTCCNAWVLVVAPVDPVQYGNSREPPGEVACADDEYCYYYRNRVTGETSWDPPAGWEELVQGWQGWTLCCEEDAPDDFYW
jgi:hypothetical protein